VSGSVFVPGSAHGRTAGPGKPPGVVEAPPGQTHSWGGPAGPRAVNFVAFAGPACAFVAPPPGAAGKAPRRSTRTSCPPTALPLRPRAMKRLVKPSPGSATGLVLGSVAGDRGRRRWWGRCSRPPPSPPAGPRRLRAPRCDQRKLGTPGAGPRPRRIHLTRCCLSRLISDPRPPSRIQLRRWRRTPLVRRYDVAVPGGPRTITCESGRLHHHRIPAVAPERGAKNHRKLHRKPRRWHLPLLPSRRLVKKEQDRRDVQRTRLKPAPSGTSTRHRAVGRLPRRKPQR